MGRASVGRLLEIALAQMRREPAILRGDANFYEALLTKNKARAHALTAYYAGRVRVLVGIFRSAARTELLRLLVVSL